MVKDALEAATLEQKDRLLELTVQKQNLLESIAELTRDFKSNKKDLDEPLNRIEIEIFSLLEEVATGQKTFFEGEEGEKANENKT